MNDRVRQFLEDAFAELRGEYGLTEAEAVKAWLDFIKGGRNVRL
jgi:hypothetical protein